MRRDATQRLFSRNIFLSVLIMVTFMVLFSIIFIGPLSAQNVNDQEQSSLSQERADVQKFGLIAAAIAFGFGALGAGIAIGNVGSAAMGTLGEKPELASQALIFIALAEGLVVFGFITALMILGKV